MDVGEHYSDYNPRQRINRSQSVPNLESVQSWDSFLRRLTKSAPLAYLHATEQANLPVAESTWLVTRTNERQDSCIATSLSDGDTLDEKFKQEKHKSSCFSKLQLPRRVKTVLTLVFALFCSLGVTFLNKSLFSLYPQFAVPATRMFLQEFSILVVYLFGSIWSFKLKELTSKPTFEELRGCALPSLAYMLSTMLSMYATEMLTLTMYRRLGPVMMLIMLAAHPGKRKKLQLWSLPSMALFIAGFLVGAVGSDDHSVSGYVIGGLSAMMKNFYTITICSACKRGQVFRTIYHIRLISTPLAFASILFLNEREQIAQAFSEHQGKLNDYTLWLLIVGTIASAAMLAIASALQSRYNHPLTISVVNTIRSTIVGAAGMFIFGGNTGMFTIVAVVLSTLGGAAAILPKMLIKHHKAQNKVEDIDTDDILYVDINRDSPDGTEPQDNSSAHTIYQNGISTNNGVPYIKDAESAGFGITIQNHSSLQETDADRKQNFQECPLSNEIMQSVSTTRGHEKHDIFSRANLAFVT